MIALYRSAATGVLMELIDEDETTCTVVGVFESFYFRAPKASFERHMRIEPCMTRDGKVQWI